MPGCFRGELLMIKIAMLDRYCTLLKNHLGLFRSIFQTLLNRFEWTLSHLTKHAQMCKLPSLCLWVTNTVQQINSYSRFMLSHFTLELSPAFTHALSWQRHYLTTESMTDWSHSSTVHCHNSSTSCIFFFVYTFLLHSQYFVRKHFNWVLCSIFF